MIQWILLTIIVGLALAYCLHAYESVEGMSDYPPTSSSSSSSSSSSTSTAPFADPADTDPDDLPWLASLSKLDRVARHGNSCTVMADNPGPEGTRLQTVSRTCESGMPHTADGDRIRIPDLIPEALRESIIRHELVHIWQRRSPELWSTFYRRHWSFEFPGDPPAGIPDQYIQARRSNPDTWRHPWVRWMARWWPIAIYDQPDSPRLRESHTVWWDEHRQQILDTPPTEWTSFFGYPSQDEHPHEISAVYLTDGDMNSEAARRLQRWWEIAKSHR